MADERSPDQAAARTLERLTPAPSCACKTVCGDAREADDDPRAICRGLPRGYSVEDDNEGIEVPWLPR